MHLWYVGIIFDFYLVFPLLAIGWSKLSRCIRHNQGSSEIVLLGSLAVISLALYIGPFGSEGEKFYYLPYRLFEFLLGGIVALCCQKDGYTGINKGHNDNWGGNFLFYLSLIILICIVFSSLFIFDASSIGSDILKIGGKSIEVKGLILPKTILLLLTVFMTSLIVGIGKNNIKSKIFGYLGKRSYSLFIWHQAMIAFYRYFVSNEISPLFLIVFLIVLLILSELSYSFVEKGIKIRPRLIKIVSLAALLMIISGGYIFLKAGVVRDVPELNVYKSSVYRGMHAEYVDRVYQYDMDFPSRNGKINVLVQGNSYGRDMANVLLESPYKDSLNISYIFNWDSTYVLRIKEADYIFAFCNKPDVPDYVWKNISSNTQVYGIGTKNFGQSNGVIYANRFKSDYTNQTVKLHPWYKSTNVAWEKEWGGNYINFIDISMIGEDRVRVFTDDGKYISQDCYHLTQAGAKWFSGKLDFSKIFHKNEYCKE